jgi:sigma-B regulation protein RsbU (phosphoserine phosphatase)
MPKFMDEEWLTQYDDIAQALMEQSLFQDLDQARAAQGKLMPGKKDVAAVQKRYGLHLAQHYQPVNVLSGDIWGMCPINDHQCAIYMVDFSGHNVEAALYTFRMHALLTSGAYPMDKPGALLEQLNRYLCIWTRKGQFATMFYGVLDTKTSQLTYVGAGTTSPLHLDPNLPSIVALDGSGFPLGVHAAATYDEKTIAWLPGQSLLLYSDALTETEDEHGVLLNDAALTAWVKERFAYPHEQLFPDLLQHYNQLYAASQQDDLTVTLYTRMR